MSSPKKIKDPRLIKIRESQKKSRRCHGKKT